MQFNAVNAPRFGQVVLKQIGDSRTYALKLTDEDAVSPEAQKLCAPDQKEIPFSFMAGCFTANSGVYSAFSFSNPDVMPKVPAEEVCYGDNGPSRMNAFISLLQRAKSTSPAKVYQAVKKDLASFLRFQVWNADRDKDLADQHKAQAEKAFQEALALQQRSTQHQLAAQQLQTQFTEQD